MADKQRNFTPLHQRRRAVLSGKAPEKRTVEELRANADSLGIDVPSKATKDEIIAALRGEPAPAEPVETPSPADAEED